MNFTTSFKDEISKLAVSAKLLEDAASAAAAKGSRYTEAARANARNRKTITMDDGLVNAHLDKFKKKHPLIKDRYKALAKEKYRQEGIFLDKAETKRIMESIRDY